MSRLRERLIEQYNEHYARVNTSIQPDFTDQKRLRSMDLQYSELVRALKSESKILDLGCGTGFLLNWLAQQPNLIAVGVDSSEAQVAVAQRYLLDVELHVGDGLEFLRARPSTFAGIFCTDVLEHIPGDDLLLEWVETAKEALTPGGFFYCRSPNGANILSSYSRYMDLTHERAFTRTSMLQLLQVAGLERCRIVPVRAAHLSGKVRLQVEWLFHKAIFLLNGRGMEDTFTTNVCAVGFKKS